MYKQFVAYVQTLTNTIASAKYNIIHHGHDKEQIEICNTIIKSGL